MKNSPLLLILSTLFLYNCIYSDKEKTTEADSLTNVSQDSVRYEREIDTLFVDTLITKSVFNSTDSQSYFIFTNYIPPAEDKPVRNTIQTVDSTCAILIYPADEQLKDLEKTLGENFSELFDDYTYYQGLAIEMLDSIDVETANAEKRYLRFKGKKSNWVIDIRKEGAPAWNLIFFDVTKEPLIISMKDLSHNKIIEYFGVKPEQSTDGQ